MVDVLKDLIIPSGLIASFSIGGLIFVSLRKLRVLGIWLFVAAAFFYAVFGSGPVSSWLLGSLEHQYPPVRITDKIREVRNIVVLSGHGWDDPNLPLSGRLNSASAFRSIEALRLLREIPESEILIVGGAETPKIMRDLAISLGGPAGRISIESNSENTYENALEIQKRIGKVPFILVTSAGHMPRTIKVFEKLGMNPIPAPTHYMSAKDFRAVDYLPTLLHLQYSDFAVHEYIGMFWYWLRNYS